MQRERNDHQHRSARSGSEWDWTTGWRRAYNWGSGVGRYIKRCMSRRARQSVKQELLRGDDNEGE